MSEKQELARIWAVTDDDTGMYRIGEVDGGFNGNLQHQIEKYGSDELLKQLAYMTHTVIEMQRKQNSRQAGGAVCAKAP